MQVRIYSRDQVVTRSQEGILSNAAVICFYDINRGSMNLPLHIESYQVAMDGPELSLVEKFHLAGEIFFPEAEIIAHFVFYAKTAGLDIICVCENGINTSAGCAAAIRQFFDRDGIEVFANYVYSPNRLMYHKILDALIAESFERGEVTL